MLRIVALFSGGLDSMLAVRVVQLQGFEVEGLHVRPWYRCGRPDAAQAAARLGMRLTVLTAGEDYAEVLRRPRFGYGRGANPCVDCRIYMGRLARRLMDELGAVAVISGEVLGQRPMSQKRRDLDAIAFHSGLEDRLLRPLSAQLLPPTRPEREGLIDRQRLYAFTGRSRTPQERLAAEVGLGHWPGPSSGCALVHPEFGDRVRELMRFRPRARRWEFELAHFGHYRWLPEGVKVVVGRNAEENAALSALAADDAAGETVLVEPENFHGATALIAGPATPATLGCAAAEIARRTRHIPAAARLRITDRLGRRSAAWSAIAGTGLP
jgi:tRNA-specific 2-thiouridylase